jgi:Ca-activated chloride channel family protein
MVRPSQKGPRSRTGTYLVLVTVAGLVALAWQARMEGGFLALWLTPDQQARTAFEDRDFPGAFELFEDPAWKGVAAYWSGLYDDSAAAFGRIASAEGFYNRGNAFMKAGDYGKAITAYEQAVAEAPDWLEAQDNLRLATYTLEYIERAREQSDTGDESELSADEFVYDNTSDRGVEIEITQQSAIELESAEKWMRSVDTETSEFLRTRFLLESYSRDEP